MSVDDLFVVTFPWLLTVGCVLVIRPLEAYFPRVKEHGSWQSRSVTIGLISVMTLLVATVASRLTQQPIIILLNPFKIFSIAKLQLPAWVIFSIGFLFIDAVEYAIHRLSHGIKPLWRLHAIHHSDEHVTAASGLLHHPLEPLISYAITMTCFVLVGMPILVVFFYVIIAAIHNAFSHANIRLPQSIDRMLRLVIVTPGMHGTHHSVAMAEGNSNFGQIFSFWDRLFDTYTATPSVPEGELIMGLPDSIKPEAFRLKDLLLLPFR